MRKLAVLLVVMLTTSCVANETIPAGQSEPAEQSTTTEESGSTELEAKRQKDSEDYDSGSDEKESEKAEKADSQANAEFGVAEPVETEVPELEPEQKQKQKQNNETSNYWFDKCKSRGYRSDKNWAPAYDQVIDDICSTTNLNQDNLRVIYGPNTDPNDPLTKKYVDTAYFAFTYWSKYVPDDYPRWTFVMASPEDESWWDENYEQYTSVKNGLTECRYFDENDFCSYKYSSDEGQTNFEGSMNLMVIEPGSPIKRDTFIDPGHNAPHWYQKAHSYQHWHEYLIEGHATLYENAFHILNSDNDNHREGFAWLSYIADTVPFTATTPEGVSEHYEKCYGQGGRCNHFYYGGAAMLHEKLILDFGYKSYLQWHEKLTVISSAKKRVLGPPPGIAKFNTIFEDHFGTSYQEYLDKAFAGHVAGSYAHYFELWDSRGQTATEQRPRD